MPFQDSFDHSVRPGFIHTVDAQAARRQFQVSLGVTLALLVAIGGSAIALRPVSGFDQRAQRASISDTNAISHHGVDAALVVTRPAGG